jgi:hypothetical protein
MCRGATPSCRHRDRQPLLAAAAAVIIITACALPAGGTDTVNGETVCRLVGGEGGALVCTGWANGDAFSWTRPNVTVGRGELWLPRPALPPGAGSIALIDLAGAGIRSLIPMSFEVGHPACILDLLLLKQLWPLRVFVRVCMCVCVLCVCVCVCVGVGVSNTLVVPRSSTHSVIPSLSLRRTCLSAPSTSRETT